MSAAQHTPGPWKAVSESACQEIEVMEIAEVSHMRVIPAAGGWPTAGSPEDDARLIAAAPELLEALQFLMTASGEQLTTAFEQAQDAIRKATGEATP
jgi:hypothetical protein